MTQFVKHSSVKKSDMACQGRQSREPACVADRPRRINLMPVYISLLLKFIQCSCHLNVLCFPVYLLTFDIK